MTARRPPQERLFPVAGAPVARVRRYVDRQVKAQRATGTLEPVDDGLIGVVLTMADVIDREVVDRDGSAFVILNGCKALAAVLLDLRGGRGADAGGDPDADAALAALVREIRDASRPGP